LINNALHLKPVPLDVAAHRELKVAWPLSNFSPLAKINAIFIAAAEFADACREFPIVFVRGGKDEQGREMYAPIAVLGLKNEQNLFLDGGRWRARYMPALLHAYPFCIGRMEDGRFAVCADMSFGGVGAAEGQPLFDADAQPSPMLAEVQRLLQLLENEAERTRLLCQRLAELDLLREMQFDATLPDGTKHRVDGFLTVDTQQAQKLTDAQVGELHRNGVLSLIQIHWVSLGNTRHLLERYVEVEGKAAPAGSAAASPAAAAAAAPAAPT
jgi:hypothetical protein